MERPVSRRSPRQSPEPLRCQFEDDDKKDRKRPYYLHRNFRLMVSRWTQAPYTKVTVRKIIFVGCIGCLMLCLSMSRNATRSSTRSFLKKASNIPRGHIHRERIDIRVTGERIMNDAGYVAKPRSMGYYFAGVESDKFLGVQRLDPNLQRRLTHNIVKMTKNEIKAQQQLEDSEDYAMGATDPFEEGDCVAQYEWQKTSYPSCNTLHEFSLTNLYSKSKKRSSVRLVNNGYWRDVWVVRDYRRRNMIVKTLRYGHDWEERNFDRHRRDAVAMEHLSSSTNVVDIYGFCGNSVISEFAPGGDLWSAFNGNTDRTNSERLLTALQVASGIADMHNVDKEGQASIVHSDISTGQFVWVDGHFKLNDFNRCRFLRWNTTLNTPCPFEVGNNPGTFRAPEEYAYEGETEKIDVYSMGNIFYFVLTGIHPFGDEDDKDAQAKVMRGERPEVPEEILSNEEPEVKVMLTAMEMCWVQNPKERATAREVVTYLEGELRKLQDPNR